MRRMLLVDDDPAMTMHYGAIFIARGYDVVSAGDGVQARHILRTAPVDCVVTDLIMPECNGFELIEHCRATWPAVRVAAMSSKGNPQFDYLTYALDCGAHFAFHKGAQLDYVAPGVDSMFSPDWRPKARAPGDRCVLWPDHMLRPVSRLAA